MIITRSCDRCGKSYESSSKRSKYCSGTCRTRASRAGESGQVVQLHPESVERDGRNVAATRAELDTLDAVDSALGVTALTLAARLDDSSKETGNSVASISRELRAVMAEVRMMARPANAITGLRDEVAAQRARWA